ncbi:MAG: PAS domain S-box protein [Acidobacteria bacterium]|nr:PAS domain S-box protein [Acidobacteriota bacterium]
MVRLTHILLFILLVLTGVWLLPVQALAPPPAAARFINQVFQLDDGLPMNSVLSVAQTADGYLWLGTEEGLVRYDGKRFTIFNKSNTPELVEHFIQALLVSRDGSLWIGTMNGLLNYQAGHFKRYGQEAGLSNALVSTLYEDRDGGLWVGSVGGGVQRFKDGSFHAITTKDGLSHDVVRSICQDHEGRIWVGTGKGLNLIQDGKLITHTALAALANETIRALYEDRQQQLWIGTSDRGVFRLSGAHLDNYTTQNGLVNNSVYTILEDRQGRLWLGTNGGGLSLYHHGSLSRYTSKEGLSSDLVMSLCEDHEGGIWVATTGGGLNRLTNKMFATLSTAEGLSSEVILPLLEDRRKRIWIGTAGAGLNRLTNGKVKTFTNKDGLSHNLILSLAEDPQGNLWVGTLDGLNRISDDRVTVYKKKDGLSNTTITALLADASGNLWIGTHGGINLWRDGKFTAYTSRDGLGSDIVSQLFQDRSGTLWIGTRGGGLSRCQNGRFTTYKAAQGFAATEVYCFYEDAAGALWIGTNGSGLLRFKDEHFTSFTVRQGLFDDLALAIVEDLQGFFWISSNKGLYRVKKIELDAVADGQLTAVRSRSYGKSDGMNTVECNGGVQPSVCKTNDGRLWFPTMKGIVIINPETAESNAPPPPVVIEEVRVDRESAPHSDQLSFAAGKQGFEFQYSAPGFNAPEKAVFRYQLEGHDKDWIEAETRRTAYYASLSPGHYTFRVSAANADGVWSEPGAAVSFELRPYFYQTRWFYALAVLALALLLGGSHLFRTRHLRIVNQELEARIGERTREVLRQKDATALINQQLVETVQALEEAKDKLEHRVQERTAELVRSNRELQEEIAERQRAEAALRDSEERYRFMFEKNPFPMWVCDLQTLAFLTVNEAAIKHYGYTKDEFLGMTIKDIRPAEDIPALLDRLATLSHEDNRGFYRHRKKSGALIDVEVIHHQLDASERPSVLVMANDITEQKRLEDELRQSQKMEAIGRLAGGVAHDFNNLLTAIIGYSQLIMRGLDHDDPIYQEIQEIDKAGQRAAALTNQLLAFSRKQLLQPKIVNLGDIVNDISKMLKRVIREDINLTILASATLGQVKVDPGQIEQILMNLAVNASDAMPHGGRLTIETCNITLDENAVPLHAEIQPGRYVMLAISDTGFGMDSETLAQIFEPFFTTKEMGKGTGLGLATVYGIVKQSGGHIWVYSEPDHGTTFKIYLPRTDQAPELPERRFDKEVLPQGSETILLAEDEEIVRNLARIALDLNGYTVLESASGAEALQVAQQHQGPIHLLLTDIIMPQMNGRVLVERVALTRPDTKVLYMSGYTADAINHHGVLDEDIAFIQKPFSPLDLIRKVREVLDHKMP